MRDHWRTRTCINRAGRGVPLIPLAGRLKQTCSPDLGRNSRAPGAVGASRLSTREGRGNPGWERQTLLDVVALRAGRAEASSMPV